MIATPRAKVLVVEDDADFREAIRIQLESHGFDVREAESAGAAWTLIAHESPRAIVMDVVLPGIDGETLARQIRHAAGSQVLIVAFTGLPLDRLTVSAFDAVVEKPDVSGVASCLYALLALPRSPEPPPDVITA